jgi:hypothetical protein
MEIGDERDNVPEGRVSGEVERELAPIERKTQQQSKEVEDHRKKCIDRVGNRETVLRKREWRSCIEAKAQTQLGVHRLHIRRQAQEYHMGNVTRVALHRDRDWLAHSRQIFHDSRLLFSFLLCSGLIDWQPQSPGGSVLEAVDYCSSIHEK